MNTDSAAATPPHPRALYYLFFAEMWERFSFYGMRALLLAYMVSQLKFDEPRSYSIVGSYAALVYAMPMFGGLLADRLLGFRKAIAWGGILMSIGHFVLAIPQGWSFFYGMAFIICGNGFFKPNISSLVGTLYEKDDPRKDSAFSLFYMGINIGAALGGAICGYVGQRINWHLGFGLAGIFMILGLIVFRSARKVLGDKGYPPSREIGAHHFLQIPTEKWVYILTLVSVPLIVLLFRFYEAMDSIMLSLGGLALIYVLFSAFRLEAEARRKLLAALILITSSVLFWAFYEQSEGSLNLFAIRNVNMHVAGLHLAPLSVNNFLPPFWVISLSPVFAWIWLALGRKDKEPSTPLKFGSAFLFMALSFAILYSFGLMNTGGRISLWGLVLSYFFLVCGELCLSPIGLSMVTKLSPAKMVGAMMGIWFLATSLGEFLAGKIGSLMSVPEGITNPVKILPYYQTILYQIAIGSAVIGVIVLALMPLLKKWMGKVR